MIWIEPETRGTLLRALARGVISNATRLLNPDQDRIDMRTESFTRTETGTCAGDGYGCDVLRVIGEKGLVAVFHGFRMKSDLPTECRAFQ